MEKKFFELSAAIKDIRDNYLYKRLAISEKNYEAAAARRNQLIKEEADIVVPLLKEQAEIEAKLCEVYKCKGVNLILVRR